MSFDQWKTASPYDDFDDTSCWHCGEKLPDKTDERKPWIDGGYCSFECATDKRGVPCSRSFYNWLLYTFGATDLKTLNQSVKAGVDGEIEWMCHDTIRVNGEILEWPATEERLGSWLQDIEERE